MSRKDLHVPTSLSSLPKDMSVRDRLSYLRSGLENRLSNIASMFRIAKNRSFPWNPKTRAYSLEIFRTSSTKSGAYLEPLRHIALDSYQQINTAIAVNDVRTLRNLTDGAYRQRALARAKSLHTALSKKAASRTRYVWRLHSLASPVTCVSVRGQQGHFGRTAPLFGTRWVIQACMKLDTWQSLATISPSSSSEPAPKRVLEYLVLEKRMWYDEPWVVRDQLWEGLPIQPQRVD
ncbi:hypothetical protein JB92DRAFT_2998348 [Gautieria morchelliformis]|nr:hypothetical protein JB92DRAFT_2998348 [Gautieria morchelliformis]